MLAGLMSRCRIPAVWAAANPSATPVLERAAVDEFCYQILPAVRFTGLEDREDVGMVERGGRLRFLLEPPAGDRVSHLRRQELDGDDTVEPRIARAIDLAHPTASEHGENVVRSQGRADQGVHRVTETENCTSCETSVR